MHTNRFSLDNFDFPSPPNTPLNQRQFTGHGLSNLNPQSEYTQQPTVYDSYQQDYRQDYGSYSELPQLFDNRVQQSEQYQQPLQQSFQGFDMNSLTSSQQLQHQQTQQPRHHNTPNGQAMYTTASSTGGFNDAENYSFDEHNKPIRIYKCPRPLCTKVLQIIQH